MPAGVDDQRLRRLQRLDLLEPQRAFLAPRQEARRRRLQRRAALATSAVSAGMPACCAACSARASAARALFARSRRIAIPATASSCAARDAGGNGAGSSPLSVRSASSRRPTSSRRRTSRWRACAAFGPSPCRSSVARAASSALVGQPSSRETSAISASATTQRARPPPPWRQRRAPRASPGLSRAGNRRAAPWRCRATPAPARPRAGRPGSGHRADHPPPARAPRP